MFCSIELFEKGNFVKISIRKNGRTGTIYVYLRENVHNVTGFDFEKMRLISKRHSYQLEELEMNIKEREIVSVYNCSGAYARMKLRCFKEDYTCQD